MEPNVERAVRESIFQGPSLQQKPEVMRRASEVNTAGRSITSPTEEIAASELASPEAETSSVCSRNGKEANVAGAE